MNAERLHALARLLQDELARSKSPDLLNAVVEHLQQSVQQPQQAQHQQNLAKARGDLAQALVNARSNDFSPAWRQYLTELGIEDLLGNALHERVEDVLGRNEITPAAAVDELQPINQALAELKTTLEQLTRGMDGVGIPTEDLEPGDFEVGMLIPRREVNNELRQLTNEFAALRSIVLPFEELATGSRSEPKVNSIASSDFTAFLEMAGPVAGGLAIAIERIQRFYLNHLQMRKTQHDLKEQGFPPEFNDQVAAFVTAQMDKRLDEITEELREEFGADGSARSNELRNELRNAVGMIASRIDAGFNFEMRAASPETEDGEEVDEEVAQAVRYAETIRQAAPWLGFMNLTGERILALPDPQHDGPVDDVTSGGATE